MIKARVITIGTEITSGEVVNTNAAWVSLRLEELGIRVVSHLSVTDQKPDILWALAQSENSDITVVTGGLGPTSDDITRNCVAEYAGKELRFDNQVFADLEELYRQRALPLREAHKQQCFFPEGCESLPNPVGTALGFALKIGKQSIFVLPGPPRELEGIWKAEVDRRLRPHLPRHSFEWRRWTCLGLPESEVAELVEAAIAGVSIEVGYRAHVPYVKVKVYADAGDSAHAKCVQAIETALAPNVVARGLADDLAVELLSLWPYPEMSVLDTLSDGGLAARLYGAQRELRETAGRFPHLNVLSAQFSAAAAPVSGRGLEVRRLDEEFSVLLNAHDRVVNERKGLPYKLSLSSERGKRSATEWVLWICVKALRAI